jgi:hypothetical protein
MRTLAFVVTASLLASGSAVTAKRDRNLIPEARPTGTALSCIHLPLDESRVRSDKIIDFRARDRKWYRNELPYSCPSLRSEERFSFSTSQSQLCSLDIIHVLHSYGGGLTEGAGCGLGKFQPVDLVKTR